MLTNEQIVQFEKDGFLLIENYLTQTQCDTLIDEIHRIIESKCFLNDLKHLPPSEYFLGSNERIRGFLESKAHLDENTETSKHIYKRIGYGLHALNPLFKDATYNQTIEAILKSLGYKRPVVAQGMYLFKQPFIGDELRPHQDATYLYAEPIRMVGVWVALQDATEENGCLKFIPGSHKDKAGLSRRWIRNTNRDEFEAGKCMIYTADEPILDDNDFVAVPVKAGSALLIDGLVRHRSGENVSSKSRHAYTFHVYDSGVAKWSEKNWLAENPTTFLPIYNEKIEDY